MAEVRLLFDACCEKYPVMAEYLKAGANIVHTPTFENAVVKATNDVLLNAAETKALAPFLLSTPPPQEKEDEVDFASEVLRRAKKPRRTDRSTAAYTPLLKVIPPTSNHCERLFSQCKYVLSPHRASLMPATFEMIIFLKANRDMWNAGTLVATME